MTSKTNNILLGVLTGICFLGILSSFGISLISKNKIETIISEKDLLDLEVSTLNKQFNTLKFDFKKLNLDNSQTKITNEILAKENSSLSEDITQFKNETKLLTQDYNFTLQDKNNLQLELESIQKEKNQMQEKIEDLESNSFIKNMLKRKVFLEIKIDNLTEQLKKQKQQSFISLNNARKIYTQETTELNKEIKTIKKNLVARSKDVDEIKVLKQELDLLKQENQELITQTAKVNKSFSFELAQENALKIEAKTQTSKLEKERNELIEQIAQMRENRAYLESKIEELISYSKEKDTETTKLKTQLNSTNKQLQLRIQELARTQDIIEGIISQTRNSIFTLADSTGNNPTANTIDLKKIIVTPENATIVEEPEQKIEKKQPIHYSEKKHKKIQITGNIIEIDNKYSFIVIDLGSNQGITKDSSFEILQNNNKIATASPLEVRESITAATITPINNNIVRKNDIAVVA
jgi:chromosome segregation ATPase